MPIVDLLNGDPLAPYEDAPVENDSQVVEPEALPPRLVALVSVVSGGYDPRVALVAVVSGGYDPRRSRVTIKD
jgi:hypothetical protein